MGNEIAQFIEWRYYEGIQYFLAEQYDTHRHHQRFVRELNGFYNEHPALWQRAFAPEGFEWIDADNADQSIISFARKGDKPGDELVILINFDVNARENFRMGVPEWGVYEELFNSDDERYGGSGVINTGKLKCQDEPWNGREQSIVVRVPPLGGMILKKTGTLRRPAKKKPAAEGAAKSTTRKASSAAKKATATKAATKKASTAKKAEAKPAAKAKTTSTKKTASK